MASQETTTTFKVTPLPDDAHAPICDTLDIDQDAHLLYAGDNWSGGLDVFDISSAEARYVKTIRIGGRMYGVVVAKDLNRVFVGVSGSLVVAIDTEVGSETFHRVVGQINTGGVGAVDLLDYVPAHKRLYAANRADGFAVAIDVTRSEIVGRIEGLGSGLEQPRFNPTDGMIYLTDNKKNVLYQIDAATFELTETFTIADDCYPNGLAINPKTNQALLACSNKNVSRTVIWDLGEQRIASVILESGGGDGAIYDSAADRFLFAADDYTEGPVMGVFGGDPVRLLANVRTAEGASWVAYDRTNRVVYAPTVQNGKPALLSFPLPDA